MRSRPLVVVLAFALALLTTLPAAALELGSRRIEVATALDIKTGMKLASDILKLDEADHEPIYLLITATGGTAQGVMLVADAIHAIESPIVAVVLSPLQGAAATLPVLCDRVVMLPSATLVLTEVDYEGVAKPADPPKDPKPDDKDKKEPTKTELFLQKVRVDYLDRFWAAVAKRLGDKPQALAADIAAGGRVITAEQAVQKKVAFEIVTSLVTQRVPAVKTELKVITTKTKSQVVPDAPETN